MMRLLKTTKVLNTQNVNQAMEIYSQPRFQVDVLKVEIPVNMSFVEGFSEKEVVYTQSEAAQHFKAQADHTPLPYIFLSAGVSAQLFQETLIFAHKSGSTFNGVLLMACFVEERHGQAQHNCTVMKT